MRCRDTLQDLEKLEEGELTFWKGWVLRLHFLMCPPCKNFKQNWDAIKKRLKKLDTVTQELTKEEKAIIKSKLQ